ncbi:hypothetical protein B0H13DRAFT_1889678 [Mycena leptocephala]|nr:hypothetical protein B0H13DRAFT_1889678 [Mycena leptocephala]
MYPEQSTCGKSESDHWRKMRRSPQTTHHFRAAEKPNQNSGRVERLSYTPRTAWLLMLPQHAIMLFPSFRFMNPEFWKSIPETTSPEEAMHWKLYSAGGHRAGSVRRQTLATQNMRATMAREACSRRPRTMDDRLIQPHNHLWRPHRTTRRAWSPDLVRVTKSEALVACWQRCPAVRWKRERAGGDPQSACGADNRDGWDESVPMNIPGVLSPYASNPAASGARVKYNIVGHIYSSTQALHLIVRYLSISPSKKSIFDYNG